MGTNPNLAVGTNGAYGGRTSVNAFNDVLGAFTGPGIVSGWQLAPQSGMTIAAGGVGVMRDVAIAEDTIGNRTTINNRSGSPVPVEIPAASATSNRIDCVIAYVNSPATVNYPATLDNPEAVGLIDVKGTTSAPDDAAIRAAITADGGTGTTAYYVILATISVPAGTTVITQNLITQGAMVMTRVLNGSINSSMIDWATSDVTSILNGSIIRRADKSVYRLGKMIFISMSQVAFNSVPGESSTLMTGFPMPVKSTWCYAVPMNKTDLAPLRLQLTTNGELTAYYPTTTGITTADQFAINFCYIAIN